MENCSYIIVYMCVTACIDFLLMLKHWTVSVFPFELYKYEQYIHYVHMNVLQ